MGWSLASMELVSCIRVALAGALICNSIPVLLFLVASRPLIQGGWCWTPQVFAERINEEYYWETERCCEQATDEVAVAVCHGDGQCVSGGAVNRDQDLRGPRVTQNRAHADCKCPQ